jgi:hypothetical protein
MTLLGYLSYSSDKAIPFDVIISDESTTVC